MKVLVLLALVALCYSSPLTSQRRVTVVRDDTITIVGDQGSEIDIYRSVTDPRKINIILKSQYGIVRKIQVDETANIKNVNLNVLDARFFKNIPMEQITQADILTHIFREYEGLVDEPTYKILLGKIESLVQQGYLHEAILEALKTLDQLQMVEQLKQVEAKSIMNNIVSQKVVEDVYPVDEVNQLRKVSEVVPVEQVYGVNQYKNNLPILRNYGIQGLSSIKQLTPYQRQVLLQQIKQNVQYQQGVQGEYLPIEILLQQELKRELAVQQVMEQVYQNQINQNRMTPLNRFLYNIGVLKGQGYYYPQQLRIPQIQGQYQYQQYVPEQLEQNQYVNQQQIKNLEQLVQNGEQYPYYQVPQYYVQQVYGQVYPQVNQQVYPQVNEQVYPQVYSQEYVQREVSPQVEQVRVAPQQNVYQQYGYGRVPFVY